MRWDLLVYASERPCGLEDQRLTWVHSPIACLSAASQEHYDLMAILFAGPFKQQQALVELCSALKTNRFCADVPIAALVTREHRQLFEQLARARVDYLKRIAWPFDGEMILDLPRTLTPEDRPGTFLRRLCPHIRYRPISKNHDLTVCAAYRYRLVLGRGRLKELCEHPRHRGCPYFQEMPPDGDFKTRDD